MRITAGLFRSRVIEAPRGTATRPTSDRVREALFSILTSEEALGPGCRVLDLYAGTGALALEAISRGAEAATLVEKGRDALAAIAANVRALGVEDRVRVFGMPVERALPKLAERSPFDLVFADPPYAEVAKTQSAVARMLGQLSPLLSDDARLVLEHSALDEPPAIDGLRLVERRRYGDTKLGLYAK